jgi:hypothetical protein
MPSYTVDQTKAGTVLQAGAGTLVSIQMTQPPTGAQAPAGFDFDGVPSSGYLAFVDNSLPTRRVLMAVEANNPALGISPAQPVPLLGSNFGRLLCSSVPSGALYTLVTT